MEQRGSIGNRVVAADSVTVGRKPEQVCPYLPGKEERKVFTHLVGERAGDLNDLLTHGGFRRSQSIAYRPACEACRACVSVRVVADEFRPSRSMRRVRDENADLIGEMRVPVPTSEQYSVFRGYLDHRHFDGGMADMTVLDYAMMVEDSHVETKLVEYRAHGPDSRITGRGTGDAAGGRADRRAERRPLDGLFVLRSRPPQPLARHLHDPRPHRARAPHGPRLCLSRLLGAGLAQDGLQGPLPAAGTPAERRLDPVRD